ncbi:MAG: HAD family hydrolase [Jatrophihabitans sp.]|uniref:HAD family hydrolase n=1 Tax=Jatrophihabitans sp. TaxID=1932789 RepID=UPI003F822913
MSKGVLFDVDGTLVDTTYLHTVCWAEAFRQVGRPQTFVEVHRTIGRGGDETLDHLLGEDRDRSDDEELQATHVALYKTYWGRLTPLPGAQELLRRTKAAGLTVVLASSASEDELQALLSALDCDDAIDVATSSTDADAGKPAPDLLQAALDKAGLRPDDGVYVGDAIWDGITCGKAGLPFVGVLSGGISEVELRKAGAVEVYPGPQELLDAFDRSALGRLLA